MSGVAGDCEDMFGEMLCGGKSLPLSHQDYQEEKLSRKMRDDYVAKHHVPCFSLNLVSGKTLGKKYLQHKYSGLSYTMK